MLGCARPKSFHLCFLELFRCKSMWAAGRNETYQFKVTMYLNMMVHFSSTRIFALRCSLGTVNVLPASSVIYWFPASVWLISPTQFPNPPAPSLSPHLSQCSSLTSNQWIITPPPSSSSSSSSSSFYLSNLHLTNWFFFHTKYLYKVW